MNLWGHSGDGLPCLGFDFIAQSGAKTNRSKNAELILLEAGVRIADCPDQPGLNVCAAVDIIDDFFGHRVIKQTVDREIAPKDVLFRIREDHTGRTASVNISLIRTECCNFKRTAVVNNKNDPKLRPYAFSPR